MLSLFDNTFVSRGFIENSNYFHPNLNLLETAFFKVITENSKLRQYGESTWKYFIPSLIIWKFCISSLPQESMQK